MSKRYGRYYLESRWGDVLFYQRQLGAIVHAENRQLALRELARSVVRFDRAERAQ